MNLQDSARIRELNDAFRQSFVGGRVMLTTAVQELPEPTQSALLQGVRCFEAFDEDNDPHQEHDFGVVEIDGQHFFWKLDYYDREIRFGSPDPADPAETTRVLTIMLAEEY